MKALIFAAVLLTSAAATAGDYYYIPGKPSLSNGPTGGPGVYINRDGDTQRPHPFEETYPGKRRCSHMGPC